jgi:hypothetical protein
MLCTQRIISCNSLAGKIEEARHRTRCVRSFEPKGETIPSPADGLHDLTLVAPLARYCQRSGRRVDDRGEQLQIVALKKLIPFLPEEYGGPQPHLWLEGLLRRSAEVRGRTAVGVDDLK